MEVVRILHVVTKMGLGGIETFLMSVYRELDREKYQFDFIVHREEPGIFDDEIRELGGKIYVMPPLNPIKVKSYHKKLKMFFEKSNYRIVHSHLNANSAIILKIAKQANIPYRIAHSHINKAEGGKWYIKSVLKNFVKKYSTINLAASIAAGNWLFSAKSKFTVIPNSIIVSKFKFDILLREKFRKELGIEEKDCVIGHIGRFTDQKNHVFLLKIIRDILTIKKSYKLILIGGGENEKLIKDKIIEYGISKNVILVGKVLNANDYFNAMDVFLFPSKFEGLGIVGIEAQANGLRTIISSCLPLELDQSDLITRVPLEEDSEFWSKIICKYTSELNIEQRTSYNDLIMETEYNIEHTVKTLCDIYSKLNK